MNDTLISRDAGASGPGSGFPAGRTIILGLVFLLPFLALISNFGVGFCSFAFLIAAIACRHAGGAALLRHLGEIRGVLIAFGLSFGFALLQMLLRHDLLRTLEKPTRELAAVTVMLTVLAVRPSRKALWYGLIAGALAGAAFIVYQRWFLGVDRPGGLINSITYGDIVLCMGMMSLAGVLDFKGWRAVWPSLGAFAGVIGSIATGTRGGWVAILFALVLFLKYGHFMRGKSFKGTALVVLALLASTWFIPQTGARNRVMEGVNDIQTYVDGGSAYTHMGIRFELWKSAATLIERRPWSGATLPQVRGEMAGLVAERQLDPFILLMPHFHNDVLQELVFGGIPGLVIWAGTLLMPFLFFLKILKTHESAGMPRVALALAGMLLVLGYFSFGLTEVIFFSVRSTMFYALMLFLIMGLCLNVKDQDGQ